MSARTFDVTHGLVYERGLHTKAGGDGKVPKLGRQNFKTAIIERYRRRKLSESQNSH